MASTRSRAAAVYCRISEDRGGAGLGVDRQRGDCEALVEREGWRVAEVYIDNDLSAYSGRERPGYRRLLEDLAAGRVDAVIAWHPDRLHRSPRELEDFIDAIEAAAAQVRTVTAGEVDLSTPTGRMHARIGVNIARYESEHRAERVRSKMQELARSGQSTGGLRHFGYRPGYTEVVAIEADHIRDAARRALAGETFGSIARDWNARGVQTARGGAWRTEAVRDLLLNPRTAGLATYKGEVVGVAQWEPILDRATHEQLVDLGRRRANGMRGRPARPRSRLLSGFLQCGRCGGQLIGAKGSSGPVYRCVDRPGDPGCQLGIIGPRTDDYVRDMVFAVLAGPDFEAALRARSGGEDQEQRKLADQLSQDEQALQDLAHDHYVERAISRAEFMSARQALQQRIESTRRALHADTAAGALAGLASTDEAGLLEIWQAHEVGWRQALLSTVIDHIVIQPARRRGQRWKPERVEVVWRA